MRVRRVLAFLRDSWFSFDTRSLGLFRTFHGLVLIGDLLRRVPVLVAFYSNEGVLANHFALYHPPARWLFSFFLALSTPAEVSVGFAVCFAVYAFYLVGYKTRVFQIATFICVVSLHNRNIMLENGGDVVMNIVACWSMFLPLGRRFSVDALIESLRARDESSPQELNDRSSPEAKTHTHVSLVCFALMLQFAVIWGFNGGNKTGMTWRRGSAVYWLLYQEQFVTGIAVWARHHVPYFFFRFMSYATLVIERAAPVLILLPFWRRPARWLLLISVWALHIGIALMTNLKFFQLSMMSFPLLLIGAADWKAWAERHRRRTGELLFVYDRTCGISHQTARLLERLDSLAQLEFIGNDAETLPAGVTAELGAHGVVVVEQDGGRVWTGARAFARVFRSLPGFAPVGWLLRAPGLAQLASVGYDLVARHRQQISLALGLTACGVPAAAPTVLAGQEASASERGPGAAAQPVRRGFLERPAIWLREGAIALVLAATGSQVLVENHAARDLFPIRQPALFTAMIQYPRIFEGWEMFSPDVPMDDGTMVVDGVTAEGRHLDPLTGVEPRFEVVPPRGEYPMQPQWCDYGNRIRLDGNAAYRLNFREYLMRIWQLEGRPPSERLVKLDAYWVWRRSPAPGETTMPPVSKAAFLTFPEPAAPEGP